MIGILTWKFSELAWSCLLEQLSDVKELDFQVSPEDLESIKVIGKGSGGVVQLVRHKWNGKLFALKVFMVVQFSFLTRCNCLSPYASSAM